ncbi:MAG: PAS domain S-box protein [Deltaproteobacteria bacterium]|nr:PAS domain S-box protein [Deltaproteobacteria bacterium]
MNFIELSFFILLSLFVLLLLFFLYTTIKKPLDHIEEFIRHISQGNFEKHLSSHGSRRFRTLAISLNEMARHLDYVISRLKLEKQKLISVLQGMHDGVLAIDSDRRILIYNESIKKILDIRDDDIYKAKFYDIVREPNVVASLESVLKNQKTVHEQIRIISDKEKFYEVIVSSLATLDPEAPGAVAIFHDITELKSLEQMRVDFVTNVSHEFKTPLTALRGYSDTLLQGGLQDEKNREKFVHMISDNVLRVENLVEDLLTISKLESAETILTDKIDTENLVRQVLRDLEYQIKQKCITVNQKLEEKNLNADPVKIHRALMNLVDNAIKCVPSGGSIEIESLKKGGKIILSVSDNGPGIESKHVARIFERFYRVDEARGRESGGSGLGLAIVKHIAMIHGGTVAVESTVGQGSSFKIILPQK